MAKCSTFDGLIQAPKSRKLRVDFEGGDICANAGVLLLGGVDQRLGVTKAVAHVVAQHDPRDPRFTTHDVRPMVAQRILAIACGHEDLNDHARLCHDPLLQSTCGRDEALASPSTLCRAEQWACREMNAGLSTLLVETFIKNQKAPPKSLTLDFDATDSILHGRQEGRFFNGYYGHYCYLPLYVFCGGEILVAHLRPSNIDGARHAWAILALLVKRLRKAWPGVTIIFRGDSGFCRHRMLTWCESHDVQYIVGIARNPVLEALTEGLSAAAKTAFEATGQNQRMYGETRYAAQTWSCQRRVIHKAEHNTLGENNRYVVTNLEGGAEGLYKDVYCARGDMENRIKEQQLDLFAERASAHLFAANQLRLLLSAFAYVLMERLRSLALCGTVFARAQCGTLRLHLLKVAAVIRRNTRSLHVSLCSSYPYAAAFTEIARRVILLA